MLAFYGLLVPTSLAGLAVLAWEAATGSKDGHEAVGYICLGCVVLCQNMGVENYTNYLFSKISLGTIRQPHEQTRR